MDFPEQAIYDEALRNPLIVQCIIAGIRSVADLRNLRLVNRLFHEKSSKQMTKLHRTIEIKDQLAMENFMKLMSTRENMEPIAFPFSSFKVSLSLKLETLESFGIAVGQYVRDLSMYAFWDIERPDPNITGSKASILLSHSPYIEEVRVCIRDRESILEISDQDLVRIPQTFPFLTTLVIWHRYCLPNDPNSNPLAHILIKRAKKLKHVTIYSNGILVQPGSRFQRSGIPDIESFRVLLKHHPNVPEVSLGGSVDIYPDTVDRFLPELIQMNFRLKSLGLRAVQYLNLSNSDATEVQVRNMTRRVSHWLEMLASTLTSLSLDVYLDMTSLWVPVLPAVTKLDLLFPKWDMFPLAINARPIHPLTSDHFPALRTIVMFDYKQEYGTFDNLTSFPHVQDLTLYNQLTPFNSPSWAVNFPNLTSLEIRPNCKEWTSVVSSIAFILTHFPRLTELCIFLKDYAPNYFIYEPDLWEVFTGGAPRPADIDDLLNLELDDIAGVHAEPLDGIYQVPSLRNMQALRTLKFDPCFRGNLDGIVYMSRPGLLVPLENLILDMAGLKDSQISNLNTFYTKLAQYHSHVEFNRVGK